MTRHVGVDRGERDTLGIHKQEYINTLGEGERQDFGYSTQIDRMFSLSIKMENMKEREGQDNSGEDAGGREREGRR